MKNQSSFQSGIYHHIGSKQVQKEKDGENGSTNNEETLGSIKDDALADYGENIFPT